MKSGSMLYAGKYNEPDYELILKEGCNFALENTMIGHNPEVKEKLESLGIPVMVERSAMKSIRSEDWSGSGYMVFCMEKNRKPMHFMKNSLKK